MSSILEKIKSPEDIRSLKMSQLRQLSEEIRKRIIDVVSKTGGHLASSLGTVEMAIGIHYVLNTPRDKVIWDVGHQAYTHKLLTGRNNQFDTLRQTGGLSGFLKPHESEYDVFAAGHASTSIAAALGIARARELQDEDFKVMAVIGDGSMTCGLVYEALDIAGTLGTDFMVVLNDNEMSIARNVGAVSHMFNRIIIDDWYNYTKNRMEDMLNRLKIGQHKIGEGLVKISHRIEESIKGLIIPGLFFEELGFRYFGPIDGHDLEALIPALRKTVSFKGPRILHVVTKKGKGYKPAEKNPETFHSAPAFHIETGERKKAKQVSFTSVFGKTILEMAEKDDRIVAITAAMPSGTGLSEFASRFPRRFYDFGIAESAAVVTAAGMASQGLRPIVAIYSTFLQRAYDMIIHDVALQNLPVIFALDRAGIVGGDGPTHHGTFDLSYLRMIPELIIMAPRNEEELRRAMATSLEYEKGPTAFRYPRGGTGIKNLNLNKDPKPLPLGKGEWLHEGKKAAVIGVGIMTNHALKAAEILKKQNIEIGVADAKFIKPLDTDLIRKALDQYERVYTLEDNVIAGGFGSGLNEWIIQAGLKKQVIPIGLPDKFIEHGAPKDLYEKYGLSAESIAERIKSDFKSEK